LLGSGVRLMKVPISDITGVILAGGRSRRFGRDKAQALWLSPSGEMTLLERSLSLLKSLKLAPLIVTHPEKDYSGNAARVVYDLIPDQGPMGGIYTAFQSSTTPFLLVLTCDMPCLTPEILLTLLASHGPDDLATLFTPALRPVPNPGNPKNLKERQPFP
jgi:molybdopterin-guanine dinucleotide biosynthesis protein A